MSFPGHMAKVTDVTNQNYSALELNYFKTPERAKSILCPPSLLRFPTFPVPLSLCPFPPPSLFPSLIYLFHHLSSLIISFRDYFSACALCVIFKKLSIFVVAKFSPMFYLFTFNHGTYLAYTMAVPSTNTCISVKTDITVHSIIKK